MFYFAKITIYFVTAKRFIVFITLRNRFDTGADCLTHTVIATLVFPFRLGKHTHGGMARCAGGVKIGKMDILCVIYIINLCHARYPI